ncbi:MAG: transposase [Alphaproteobacteria bacterium]|nr:transposase [Alphaproteobacteria bacterium]
MTVVQPAPRASLASRDLLELPGIAPIGVQTVKGLRRISCASQGCRRLDDEGLPPCPGCRIKDYRRISLYDLSAWGRPSRLDLTYSRRRCPDGGIKAELPGCVSRAWRVPVRFAEEAAIMCLEEPLAHVARRLRVDRRWLTRFFAALIAELTRSYRPAAAPVIGIDEAHINTTPAVITDLTKRRLIQLVSSNREPAVAEALRGLEGAARVEAVVIDFHRPYRRAVRAALPQARIVVDKRHVLDIARRRLMSLRHSLARHLPRRFVSMSARGARRERISAMLSTPWERMKPAWRSRFEGLERDYPALARAYRTKDAFGRFYDCPTRAAAEQHFDAWAAKLAPEQRQRFASVIRTMAEWREEVFAYFEIAARPTAGFTESINRRLKEIAREGRGNLRNRALRFKALHRLRTLGADEIRAAARRVVQSAPGKA